MWGACQTCHRPLHLYGAWEGKGWLLHEQLTTQTSPWDFLQRYGGPPTQDVTTKCSEAWCSSTRGKKKEGLWTFRVEAEQGTKKYKKSSSTHCKVVVKAAMLNPGIRSNSCSSIYFSTKEICNSKTFQKACSPALCKHVCVPGSPLSTGGTRENPNPAPLFTEFIPPPALGPPGERCMQVITLQWEECSQVGRVREQEGSHPPWYEMKSEVSGGFSAWVDRICGKKQIKKHTLEGIHRSVKSGGLA